MSNSAIYKYPIQFTQPRLRLPIGAVITRMDNDEGGSLCVWAAADPEAPMENRDIRFYGPNAQLAPEDVGKDPLTTLVSEKAVWRAYVSPGATVDSDVQRAKEAETLRREAAGKLS